MPETAPVPLAQARAPRLLVFGLAWLAGGVGVLLAVLGGHARRFDEFGIALLRPQGPLARWSLEALRDLTALGSFTVLGLAVVLVTLFLLVQRRAGLAGLFLASALAATLFSSSLKAVVDRARPDLGEALAVTFTRSFPSGHALLSAAILLTIAGFLAVASHSVAARRFIWASGLVLSLMVGLSRIVLGVHWPSDVLAGWCFGLGWSLVTLHLAGRWLASSQPYQTVLGPRSTR